MPDIADVAFLYVETALHAGVSQPGHAVDLPIQRDDSGIPLVPASTLRGSFLAAAKKLRAKDEIAWAFGSPPGIQPETPGVLVFGPSRTLLFPVRSYKGVFAWATSPGLLAAFRDAAGQCNPEVTIPSVPDPGEHEALVAEQTPVLTDRRTVIIEDFSFPAHRAEQVHPLGEWFARNALPQDENYGFFRDRMSTGIVVLPDDVCNFLLQHRTHVARRVAIDPSTGTVQQGALWTEESLPSETLLYTLIATESSGSPPPVPVNGIGWLRGLQLERLQVGANRTLGGGLVRKTWLNGG